MGTLIIVAIILVIAIVLSISIYHGQEAEINRWAASQNCTVVSSERTIFDHGPYHWYDGGKGVTFYKVVVSNGHGKIRTVWFRFGFSTEVRDE